MVTAVIVVRRPLPEVAGEQELPGLDADVTVTRDDRGVPTITATTSQDLFRAQGYVAAQDRFFEMDYRRHVTSGRLSELVGENEDALAADKVIRTFGWRRVAEQEWGLLEQSTRDALQAYADGVNAYLDGRDPGAIAVEYSVLGVQARRRARRRSGTPSTRSRGSRRWPGTCAATTTRSWSAPRRSRTIGDVARVDELFPAYPQDLNLPILTAADLPVTRGAADVRGDDPARPRQRRPAGTRWRRRRPRWTRCRTSWATARAWARTRGWSPATLTESGTPLLANDPHLGISAPGIWEQIGLRCDDGLRAVPVRRQRASRSRACPAWSSATTRTLAWGLTNLGRRRDRLLPRARRRRRHHAARRRRRRRSPSASRSST